MGKKKDKSSNDFSKVLKENKKKIEVIIGDAAERTLQEITDESIESITGTEIGSMIPITVTEAASAAVTDLPYTAIRTTYTDCLYSLYEMGIKTGQKQTLVVPLTSDATDDLEVDWRFGDILDALRKSTNIDMIWDDFPKKIMKKAATWAEDDNGDIAFVIRIPNVLMFYKSISKNKPSKPLVLDILAVITNASSKSIKKAKKNGMHDKMEEFSDRFAEAIVKTLGNYGVSSAHVPLWNEFYDIETGTAAANAWARALKESKPETLKRLSFATPDAVTLLEFNRHLIENINVDGVNGMKVV